MNYASIASRRTGSLQGFSVQEIAPRVCAPSPSRRRFVIVLLTDRQVARNVVSARLAQVFKCFNPACSLEPIKSARESV